MKHKQLNATAWKQWAKGRELDDAAWLKALAAFEKADEADPAALAETLPPLRKALEKLRASHKSDREIVRRLDEQGDEIDTIERAADKRLKQKAAEERAAGDDDEDTPVLLSDRTRDQLALLQKTRGAQRSFVIGLKGKELAVAVAKSTISPAIKKVVSEAVGGSGTKFIIGLCLFEDAAHTFVLDKTVAGLAKRLRTVLKQQTGKSYKIRLRGSDPADVDEALAEEDEADPASGDATPASAREEQAAAQPGPSTPRPTTDPERERFKARLTALLPRLRQGSAQGPAAAEEIRRRHAEAGGLAQRQAFDAAHQVLDGLERYLDSLAPQRTPAPGGDAQAMATIKQRLTALLPELQQAVASGGPESAALKLDQSQLATLLRRAATSEAAALLDRMEETVGQLLEAASQWRLRQGVLLANLRSAYGDYLALRDGSPDPQAIEQGLSRFEAAVDQARRESAGRDAEALADALAEFAPRAELERQALDELLGALAGFEELSERLQAETDPGRQALIASTLLELVEEHAA